MNLDSLRLCGRKAEADTADNRLRLGGPTGKSSWEGLDPKKRAIFCEVADLLIAEAREGVLLQTARSADLRV